MYSSKLNPSTLCLTCFYRLPKYERKQYRRKRGTTEAGFENVMDDVLSELGSDTDDSEDDEVQNAIVWKICKKVDHLCHGKAAADELPADKIHAVTFNAVLSVDRDKDARLQIIKDYSDLLRGHQFANDFLVPAAVINTGAGATTAAAPTTIEQNFAGASPPAGGTLAPITTAIW